jgi:outer membrane autotransporter protein
VQAYASADAHLAPFPQFLFVNSSSLPFSALATSPAFTGVAEVSGLLNHLNQSHFFAADAKGPAREIDAYYGPFTNSRDGRHPALRGEWQPFAFGNWNLGDFDNGRNRPVYDLQSVGGLVGIQRWFDDERLVGIAGSYNYSRAKIHNHGGHIDGDNPRLRIFAALVPEDQPWWIAFGASAGWLAYTTKRWQSVLPMFADPANTNAYARSTPEGLNAGVFAAFNARLHLTDNLIFTPFARLDFEHASISRFTEKSPDPAAMRLRIAAFHAQSVQTRLGAGLEYTLRYDSFIVSANASLGWASELAGDDIRVSATFADWGAGYTTRGSQIFGDAVEFAPTVSIALKNGLVLQAAYNLQVTFDLQFSQSISAGIGWRF